MEDTNRIYESIARRKETPGGLITIASTPATPSRFFEMWKEAVSQIPVVEEPKTIIRMSQKTKDRIPKSKTEEQEWPGGFFPIGFDIVIDDSMSMGEVEFLTKIEFEKRYSHLIKEKKIES